jgi:thioredoxin reductase (NADPH)
MSYYIGPVQDILLDICAGNMNPVIYQGMQPEVNLQQLTKWKTGRNPEGITGPEMMVQLQAQAERFGTDVRDGWATKVDFR